MAQEWPKGSFMWLIIEREPTFLVYFNSLLARRMLSDTYFIQWNRKPFCVMLTFAK